MNFPANLWKMRRKLPGLVLLLGALFVGAKLLSAQGQMASVSIHYKLPAGAASLEATVVSLKSDEPVATFSTRMVAGDVTQTTRLKPATYRVRATVLVGGEERRAERRIEVTKGADIYVDLRAPE